MPNVDRPLTESVQHAFGSSARVVEVISLVGDASTRLYERVRLAGASVETAIAMRLPPDALTRSDEAAKATRGDELPFSNMLASARSRKLRVPDLYADLTRSGNFTVLLEDLGDETFFKRLARTPRSEWAHWYEKAVDLLGAWQRAFAQPDAACVAFQRRFDRELLRWELDHFREWGIEALRGPIAPTLRAALDAEFDALANDVSAIPTTLVHRDWQSKNLMVLPDGTLAIIDFQDALVGPAPYDLVALLCDSYTSLTADEQRAWIDRHASNAGMGDPSARAQFAYRFYTQALQRKLKDTGRFVFIDRVRRNPSFLEYIPQSVRYVNRAIAQLPERARLHGLLEQLAPEWFGADAPR